LVFPGATTLTRLLRRHAPIALPCQHAVETSDPGRLDRRSRFPQNRENNREFSGF
jgi:hypothetical protein